MIRINLLKDSTRKKAPQKAVVIPKFLIIIGGALILGIGGFFGWKQIPQKVSTSKVAVVEVSKPPVPAHTGPNMIEEVVREVGDSRSRSRTNLLMIPYSEMTFPEKVNYEVLFGKTVFQLLSRAIPPGIGLKNLEIENFQTIYAVGIGDTKDLISNTFSALKNERLELLQQPYSYITANSGKGYRFVVTCKTMFGVDHAEPFQAWDHLGTRDNLPGFLKKIKKVASDNNLRFVEKSGETSVDDVGLYRRYNYHFTGSGEYKNFVAFILDLHKEYIPCAFKKIKLKAGDISDVAIEVDLLLTVKE